MRHNKVRGALSKWSSWRILWILGLFVAVAAVGMLVSQQLLLDNARTMGKNLVTSYSNDENNQLSEYDRILTMAMFYMEDMDKQGADSEEFETWLVDFFDKSTALINANSLDIYAVLNGQVISVDGARGWDYSYENQAWYRQAMEAEGEVIYTDAYASDVYDGQMVVTVAVSAAGSSNAIAFDVPLEHFRANHTVQDLPSGGAYYVLDRRGSLLYYNNPFAAAEADVQVYVESLFNRVNRGELDGKNNSIIGMQGLQRGLYYQRTENDWLCILTVPYETLLQGVQNILVYYGIGLVLFLGIAVVIWLRDRKLSRTAKRTTETVQVMGDIYYAFYRVNILTGTFEMTKPSDYVRERMSGDTGDYNELLKVIASALDEWTSEDFIQNFTLENIRQLVEQGTRDFGGEFLRKFGDEERWISVRMLTDPEKIPNEVVICFRDVENEKEEQQRQVRLLKGALSAAEQSEKSQQQFFSVMSHDMRTPLNIIIGMTGLALQPECSREKMWDYLNKIGAASQQLLALINDILEISRLEQGNVSMEIKPFDLVEILNTCLSAFQAQARTQNKTFRLSVDVKNRLVKGDPARLSQIINNLVSNSMKFTQAGDSLTVTLRQMDEGKRNNYLFVVEDTGAGMSEEFLPKLFDPYEREVRFGAKDIMGTGLGMPIVKNLVARMGGQIAVSSKLGQGTTFSVTIPFDASEAPLPQVEPEPVQALNQLEGRHILLAEDNLLNMEIATELLKMRGAQVTPAEDGRRALEAFRSAAPFTFDAVLMDMQMPEMDGCEATRAIRALNRPDAGTVPIIALTANAFAEDITRTTQAGMDAHLAKPINVEQLCGTLTKLMSQSDRVRGKTPTKEE